MNQLRGAGRSGLAGIPPVRSESGIPVIRPLLKAFRSDLLAYLQRNGLRFRQDPTNRSLKYQRNRIRHQTLPSLEQDYPGLLKRLSQSAAIFRDEEGFWSELVTQKLSKTVRKNGKLITIDLTPLLGYHKALSRRILRHILPGLSFQEVERVFDLAQSPDGKSSLLLGRGLKVERRSRQLVITGHRSRYSE
jgi:tRNA(Ile)-lysidine synthase